MRLLCKSALVATAAVAALVAGGRDAHAQTPVNPLLPTTGTREIGLSGNIIFNPNSSQDINLLYGVFLNPNVQIGGQLGYFNADNTDDVFSADLFANYHFPSASAVLPFVGVNLGVTNTDETKFSYGAQAGVKYFLNANVSVNGAFQWRHLEGAEDDTRIRLGISTYLR